MVCQSKLYWYELIPLFSFLALRGRCRTCKTKISIQYPFVELATGFIFASLFLKFQDIFFLNVLSFSFTCAYYAVMFSILIVIAAYDLRHKIIPDILALIFSILASDSPRIFIRLIRGFSFRLFLADLGRAVDGSRGCQARSWLGLDARSCFGPSRSRARFLERCYNRRYAYPFTKRLQNEK